MIDMKYCGIKLLFVLLLASCMPSNNSLQVESIREQIDITGWWKFMADPKDEGDSLKWFNDSVDKTFWPLVKVPIGFDNCGPGLERYFGTAWFFRNVVVPETFKGRRAVLHFEGISYNARIWVNGEFVGENNDPFLPFDFEVTDFVKIGEENTIAVSINNIRQLGQFPLFEGWYGQGGFLREAFLVATDQVHITKTMMVASPSFDVIKQGGHLMVKANIVNDSEKSKNLRMQVRIACQSDKELATLVSKDVSVNPGCTAGITVDGDVSGVQWWSPDSPVLYLVEISILQGDIILDKLVRRTGFRKVVVKDARLLVNSEEVYLLGFNRHEDSPRTGMAVDLEQARADFIQMKEMGCNYVRFCHYPHHPGELDLCDEIGLYVLAENAMNEWGRIDHPAPNPGIPLAPEDAPLIIENAKRTLAKMIARDNHHPSIIMWSIGNENDETRQDVSDGNNELVQFGQTLDQSRPWTHVSNSFRKEGWEKFYLYDDVIVVNVYPTHWYSATEEDIAAGLPESTRIMREMLKMIHEIFPDKPIIVGEYGFPNGDAGEAGAKKQAVATEAEFKGLHAPYVAGGALWGYARHPWPWYNVSSYGYVSRDRMSRFPAMAVVERLYKGYSRDNKKD
jgi:beta-glucuronidase